MAGILNELEETASSPCLTPFAPYLINAISKFETEECGKKWVLQSIGSSWRTHKCRLKKKFFKPNMKEEYNLKNRPSIIPLEQWKILLKFWKSNMAKERSEKNKINRAKYTFFHTIRSKTSVEIREEESELEEAITLHPEAEESTTQDDLFSQVLGKERPDFVRTYGKGVAPIDLWGTKSTIEIQKIIDEVKRNARVEMQEEMQDKINSHRKKKRKEEKAQRKHVESKSKESKAKKAKVLKDLNVPEHSPTMSPNMGLSHEYLNRQIFVLILVYVLNSHGNPLEGIHKLVDPSLEESYPIESVLKVKALFFFE
ncbi:putative transposase [Vigna unguiculata]|uniref:Putative transposase n=1 Tax=Vigna unguiculata TaxID=3917 RepID=A0A4D6LX98_VIGUN|nr:putative transposase [Vigna unguiculata]